MSAPDPTTAWSVVVPVKHASRGKSRLADAGTDRPALARAIALDTLDAVVACPLVAEVLVVTDDEVLAASLPADVHVVTDPVAGLNAAVAAGIAATTLSARAALLGDLPALRPDDLGEALTAASTVARAVVADAEGTGSTLVTAAPGTPWSSAFGAGSFAAHRAQGCEALDVPDASTLRRDVDTLEQLHAAAALGLGPRTSAMLARV